MSNDKTTRKCTECKQTKPLDELHYKRRGRGWRTKCTACLECVAPRVPRVESQPPTGTPRPQKATTIQVAMTVLTMGLLGSAVAEPECGVADCEMRRCTRCDLEKPLTKEFFRNYRGVLTWVCKSSGCKGARVCARVGCTTKKPRYGVDKYSELYCREHADPGMVDVVNRRCRCGKSQPTFAMEGDRAECCGKCRDPGMVDVVSRRCEHSECTKSAWKGIPGHSPTRCAGHVCDGMIKYPRSRCTFRDDSGVKCRELALYGITDPLHCETHVQPDENNLVERQCSECKCTFVLGPDGKCGYCNDENRIRACLAKQRQVQAYLDRRAETEEILRYCSYDRQLDGGVCGRERPDFLWDCRTHFVILEVDENQHSERENECETTRMKNIGQSLGGPKVWFIRYNPDPYRTDGDQYDPTQIRRHKSLLRTIKHCLANPPPETDFVTARYLYYNGYTPGAVVETTVEPMAACDSA